MNERLGAPLGAASLYFMISGSAPQFRWGAARGVPWLGPFR